MIRSEPHLVLLPVASLIATALVGVTFAVPIFLTTDRSGDTVQMGPASYALLFAAYLALAYITIFFNTALICAANDHFDGRPTSLSGALAAAGRRAGKILPWAIVSATVSIVLRAIQERAGIVGRLVVGLAGLAWALVTFMVLPIIALEGLGVGAAIKRSAHLFKKAWGEQVIANVGIGLVSLVAILCGLPVLLLAATGSAPLIAVGVGLFVVWVAVVSVVTSAMTVVFQTALYRFASNGDVPAAFASADLPSAFVPKKARKGLGGAGA